MQLPWFVHWQKSRPAIQQIANRSSFVGSSSQPSEIVKSEEVSSSRIHDHDTAESTHTIARSSNNNVSRSFEASSHTPTATIITLDESSLQHKLAVQVWNHYFQLLPFYPP